MPGGIQAAPTWPIQVGNNIITGTTTAWDWGTSGDNGWTTVANKFSYDTSTKRTGTRSLKFDATQSGNPASIEQDFTWPSKGRVAEISCYVQMTSDYDGEFKIRLRYKTEHSGGNVAAGIKVANCVISAVTLSGVTGISNGTYDIAVAFNHPDGTENTYTKRTSVVLSGGNNGIKVVIPDMPQGGHTVYAGSEGGTLYRVVAALESLGATEQDLFSQYRLNDNVFVDAIPTSGSTLPSGDWVKLFGRFHHLTQHQGETIEVFFLSNGAAGQVWFDDVQVRESDMPFQVALPDRWWGYVFEDDDIDAVKVEVDVNERYVGDQSGLSDNADVKVVVQLLKASDESELASVTTNPVGAGTENFQITFDMSSYAIADEFLVRGQLQKVSDSSVLQTFTDTKLIKQSISFRNSINSYIDYRTHTWVWNQRKRFLWGAYATPLAAWSRKNITSTNSDNWEHGPVGFMDYPTDTRPNLWDAMRRHHFNAWHNYQDLNFVEIASGANDVVATGLVALGNEAVDPDDGTIKKPRGIGYSIHTLEHFLWRKGGGKG